MADEDDEEAGAGGGLDPELVRSYLTFLLRAVRRRRWLGLAVAVAVAGAALGLLAVWPRTFHAESRLMAQRNQVLAARGDAGHDALRGAAELILRRDSLVAIVREAGLAESWGPTRSPLLRAKDRLTASLLGAPSPRDLEAMLVGTLEARLGVQVTDTTLILSVDWHDGQAAARILEAAEQNFLEARHLSEIATIAEYISILEGHAVKVRGEIDGIAEQVQRVREERLAQVGRALGAARGEGAAAAPPATKRAAPARVAPGPDAEIARLEVLLSAKQRALEALEDDRARRRRDAQAKLAELRTRYTDAHPTVVDAHQAEAALARPSPQVAELESEIAGLRAEIERRAARPAAAPGPGAPGPGAPGPATAPAGQGAPAGGSGPLPAEILQLAQQDGATMDPVSSAQLAYAVDKYSSLRSQIASARVDLDTAQAAFKHRYQVVVPPEAPSRAIKPRVGLLSALALVAAAVTALLAMVVAELASGRVVARFQVQSLPLPLLAELQLPPHRDE